MMLEPKYTGSPAILAQRRSTSSSKSSNILRVIDTKRELLRLYSSSDDEDSKISIKPASHPLKDLMHVDAHPESIKNGSVREDIGEGRGFSEEFAHDKEDSNTIINAEPGRQERPPEDSPRILTAHEQQARSTKSLLAYNRDHGNPEYIDLAEPKVLNAYGERLEAMRARNAEENYHDRIPPEHAPPHMQMMVLLYQWAAWAVEISDQKRRADMINWVNGRFLAFMMSGGRVPGYNLKELLELAGVDPKELYSYNGESSQQDSIANMSSSQLAATISKHQLVEETMDESEKETSSAGLDQNNVVSHPSLVRQLLGTESEPSIEGGSNNDAEKHGESNEIMDETVHSDKSVPFEHLHGPWPAEAPDMVSEPPSGNTTLGKRDAISDISDDDQGVKRQKHEIANASPLANTASPSSSDDNLRERYLQTYFKPKINVVLQNHRKSRYVKGMPDWSTIAKRLKGVSVNTISALRHDYHEGWKTWDGSSFTELANTFQNSAVSANIKAEPLATAAVTPNAPVASEPPVKPSFSPKAKAKARPKARKTEDYDPEDGEYTAAKTSVKTRNQYAKSLNLPKSRRGRPPKS
ncbi:hypothetical protein EPUS_00332 [Endocarpon pusillum Z07020]|uniref:Uncharacterized protein n=1 Tax=Endocarpon pusillum (strain Z07020 / HMAS-L-300199) TaxID=1263415 RepID=U1HIY7_ENDPU|nr:uncharacterized protein EPUS_00332 [Endocarpon pusillum Z07020]ERF70145.1 hypothetical protein EPUS_00332 [Endocarpon pusillum Z07020]